MKTFLSATKANLKDCVICKLVYAILQEHVCGAPKRGNLHIKYAISRQVITTGNCVKICDAITKERKGRVNDETKLQERYKGVLNFSRDTENSQKTVDNWRMMEYNDDGACNSSMLCARIVIF